MTSETASGTATRIAMALVALVATHHAWAANFSGDYVAVDEPSLELSLAVDPDGKVTGSLSDDGDMMGLSGRLDDAVVTGQFDDADEVMTFTARVAGDQLVLDVIAPEFQDRLEFVRASGASAMPDSNAVTINGQALDAAALARAEQNYALRIPPGDYWYDPVLGAWGVSGGPTYGFIAAGLDLGGPLAANASGGGTGIFVNGRELHPYDVAALQSVTGPILPGRYFITADGLAGYAGEPPLWNLLALAAQAGGAAGGGGSNTWQSRITGASGFSDGNSGAVFLPNGGIVSY